MPKLLVTGSGGFLGWNLCREALPDWEVYGVYRSNPSGIKEVNEQPADLSNLTIIPKILDKIQPDAVIHTAAYSNNNALQIEPEKGFGINVCASRDLAGECASRDIHFVFTSTDLVFDGKDGMYREEDEVSPITHYGEQKAEAEEIIQKINPKAAICRMPLMLGPTGTPNHSFLQQFLQRVRLGEAFPLFKDEWRTPVGVRSAAKGLLRAAKENWSGIYHLGGMERMNRLELGEVMIQALDLSEAKLRACKRADVKLLAPRQKDATLNSQKAFSRGYRPMFLHDELKSQKAEIL
jgi:dTDP-4-dehydrorhamnose reductase